MLCKGRRGGASGRGAALELAAHFEVPLCLLLRPLGIHRRNPRVSGSFSLSFTRTFARAYICVCALQLYRMLKEEVELLCGKDYSRNSEHTAQRAGSGQGSVIINGQRVPVKKPRVKVNGKEVQLRSYEMLRDEELPYCSVMQAMLSGASTANYQK